MFCFLQYRTYKITDADSVTLPLVLMDAMGQEGAEENGIPPEDLILALQGHVKEDYAVGKKTILKEF